MNSPTRSELDLPYCPLRNAGDLQLESVLPLLFTRPRRGKGFPETAILDFGCGTGSLLEALGTFPAYMLRRISYFGLDHDVRSVTAAKEVAARKNDLTPKIVPIEKALRECRIGTYSEFCERPLRAESFHLVHTVNVLHHLHPWRDVPEAVAALFKLTAVGGYLVFHDVFLGNYPKNPAHQEIYRCPDAFYYGPGELSTIYSAVWREPSTYRFFRKHRGEAEWFGFTYVLKKYAMEWHPSAWEFVPGIYYALDQMAARALEAANRSPEWYSSYASRLRDEVFSMKAAMKAGSFDYIKMFKEQAPRFVALYFQDDPFFVPEFPEEKLKIGTRPPNKRLHRTAGSATRR